MATFKRCLENYLYLRSVDFLTPAGPTRLRFIITMIGFWRVNSCILSLLLLLLFILTRMMALAYTSLSGLTQALFARYNYVLQRWRLEPKFRVIIQQPKVVSYCLIPVKRTQITPYN